MATRLIPSNPENSISELDFSLDNFRKQKVLTDDQAFAQLIKRLLLMRKGCNPSLPDMGINLGSYRFKDIDILVGADLKDEITRQIRLYIPRVPLRDIQISKVYDRQHGEFVLFIDIILTGQTTYSYAVVKNRKNLLSCHMSIERTKMVGVNI